MSGVSIKRAYEAFQEKHEKYEKLVWWARSRDRDDREYWEENHPGILDGVAESQRKVEKSYPKETALLTEPDRGDWEHGFNSGVLAAIRWLGTACDHGIEEADSEFPELYT